MYYFTAEGRERQTNIACQHHGLEVVGGFFVFRPAQHHLITSSKSKSLTLPGNGGAAAPDLATNALDKSKLCEQTVANKCRLMKVHIEVVVMKLREDIKVFF